MEGGLSLSRLLLPDVKLGLRSREEIAAETEDFPTILRRTLENGVASTKDG